MSEKNIHSIASLDELNNLIEKEDAVLIYFSHESCSVCKVLKPKIADMLTDSFPKIKMVYSDTEKIPEAAGQNRIFTVPSILVYFAGKEYIRASRNISVQELGQQIGRPYGMMFDL